MFKYSMFLKNRGAGGSRGKPHPLREPAPYQTTNEMSDKIFPVLEIFKGRNLKKKLDYHAEFFFDEETKILKKIFIVVKEG